MSRVFIDEELDLAAGCVTEVCQLTLLMPPWALFGVFESAACSAGVLALPLAAASNEDEAVSGRCDSRFIPLMIVSSFPFGIPFSVIEG